MYYSKGTINTKKIIGLLLLLLSLVLGQLFDDDLNNPNAKLVPQVSERRCFYDIDCLESNSYCKGNDAAAKKKGFCACREEHFIQTQGTNYNCIPFIEGFGSPCTIDRQCVMALGSNFAYCDDIDGCQCDDGYHFYKNRCYKAVAIGDTCQSNYNCVINIYEPGAAVRNGLAHCLTGRCACAYNQHHVTDSNTCVNSVTIGGTCSSDDECNISDQWGVCRVVCVCRVGWVVDDHGLTCLPAANEVGDTCTQLSQCTEFLGAESFCDLSTNTCQCKSGAHQVGTKCFQRRYLGDSCTHRAQCQISSNDGDSRSLELQDCVEGICQCVADGEQRGSQCVSREGGHRNNGISTCFSGIIISAVVWFFLCCFNKLKIRNYDS